MTNRFVLHTGITFRSLEITGGEESDLSRVIGTQLDLSWCDPTTSRFSFTIRQVPINPNEVFVGTLFKQNKDGKVAMAEDRRLIRILPVDDHPVVRNGIAGSWPTGVGKSLRSKSLTHTIDGQRAVK